ncbi:MAG: response regulator, partial [Candidatus Eremiobacteraeota bacterium]|nr:response regulator [Candidatus Eremiobacteraeota bacterium]
GLGLSISKRLVALMDGEIRLDTVAGVGTTFRFAIPLPRVGGASRERDRAILRGVRMLLVDTEPNARAVAERYLTRWGARVSSTPPYDVAVLAHGNGTDAYGLLAFLRETQPTLPAVFVSAYDEPGWVETARGAGFAFAVRKPLRHQALYDAVVGALTRQRVQVPAVERASVGASTGRDVAVLVVDDNAVNRKLTLQQLKRLGYGADVAENGRMAIDAVAERRFDLVLMDCEMPEVDGYTATRAIRASEATTGEHVPIVAMTANAMAGDREACLAAGMDDYLAKPVQLAELRDIVERYTGSVV